MQINSVSERLVYNNARRALASVGLSLGRTRPMQSFLRLEQPLATNKTQYLFPILINQNNPQIYNTEQRLNLQDSFVVSSIQFAVGLPSSVNDATFKKNTYLNPAIYTEYAAMGVIYNGQLKLSVDNVTFIPNWDLERHLFIPETQQTADPGAASPLDQYDASTFGYYPVEPNTVLIGSKNLELSVTLPAAPSAVDTNARMIITLRGILAQNSTSVN